MSFCLYENDIPNLCFLKEYPIFPPKKLQANSKRDLYLQRVMVSAELSTHSLLTVYKSSINVIFSFHGEKTPLIMPNGIHNRVRNLHKMSI